MSNNSSHHIFVVVGPSGVGKSSFLSKIIAENSRLVDVITNTTRAMRKGESEGDPYFFVEKEEFMRRVSLDLFVEWAEVHGNLYGTPRDQIYAAWEEGKAVIMDLDIQGADSFIKAFPDETEILFIRPESIDVLRQRIVKREGKEPDDLELRLKNAEKELEHSSKYRTHIVNDEFEKSYAEFKKIIDRIMNSQ